MDFQNTNTTCRACNGKLTLSGTTVNMQTFYCPTCQQFQLEHSETKAENEAWKEANISEVFLNALAQRRKLQAAEILNKWGGLIKQPVLDYACGQGVFLEAAMNSGINIKGADLNRVGKHAENILQVDKPWGTSVAKGFKTVVMLDVIEHNKGLESFLNDLKNFDVEMLLIKVPNSKGPSAIAARMARSLGKNGLWETLNLVGDFVPHYTFFSHKGLKKMLERSGYNVTHTMQLTEFGTELPERLRSQKGAMSGLLRLFGGFISAISFMWCDNITVVAELRK